MLPILLAVVLHAQGAGADGGTPGPMGSIHPEVIRDVVRRHHGGLKRCYDAALAGRPAFVGKVSLEWVIDPDGEVARVSVVSNTTGSDELADCLLHQVASMHFPRPQGGEAEVVSYPFVFKAWEASGGP
jgi:hypothetical protein